MTMKRILLTSLLLVAGYTQAQVKTKSQPKTKATKQYVNPVKLTKDERNRPYMDEVLKSRDNLTPEEAERRRKNIEAGNPFKKKGYYPKVATLSKGKYLEFHDKDSIVSIGSVRFNRKTKEIVEFREIDLSDPDAQPYLDTAGRWFSPDPLSEEFSSWSPYHYAYNNPINAIDPDGRESKWIPTIEFDRDKSGKITGGHLAMQMEKGDTAESLAKTLNIDQNQADKLFAGMQKSGESSIAVPESIAGSINEVINDSVVNSEDYNSKGFNCFLCAINISKGNPMKEYENGFLPGRFSDMSPADFISNISAGYEKAGEGDKIFGKTVVAFKKDYESSFLGFKDKGTNLEHASIFLGKSRNGTEYNFSKNGFYGKPTIETTGNLKKEFGHRVGYWNYQKK